MDLKPCPFCGGTKISAHDGSTFRWLYAGCGECGAQAAEVRVQTLGEGNPVMWQQTAIKDAFTEWNRRADVPLPSGLKEWMLLREYDIADGTDDFSQLRQAFKEIFGREATIYDGTSNSPSGT